MNCNTTHYRANSSSVPGDPTNYKAAGLVSYGGISGGLRAAQMLKQTLLGLKIVPVSETVAIPFVAQMIDKESGAFKGAEAYEKATVTMLDELKRWDAALSTLRK